MVRLQGHATDRPRRRKEPRALAATDHTASRTHQGRGRRSIRRRVSAQCAGRHWGGGSLIPHARPIRALMIAMIEAAFEAPAVAPARRPNRALARHGATGAGAVRVAAITGHADREDAVTATACLLAKRGVHGVGATAIRSDWTYSPNRGTTDRTATACWSPRSSRGSGGSVRALTLSLLSLRDHASTRPAKRAWTVPRLWTHRTRPQVAWKTRTERGFPTPPTPLTFLG